MPCQACAGRDQARLAPAIPRAAARAGFAQCRVSRLARALSRRLGAPLVAALLLAACAAPVDVRTVGTAGPWPAYELRGPRSATLAAQARVLCPGGHQVLRQWQRLHAQAADSNFMRRGVGWLADKGGLIEDEEAQLLVQCLPPAPPTVAAQVITEDEPAAPAAPASAPVAVPQPVRE